MHHLGNYLARYKDFLDRNSALLRSSPAIHGCQPTPINLRPSHQSIAEDEWIGFQECFPKCYSFIPY